MSGDAEMVKMRWEAGIRMALARLEAELRTKPYLLTDEAAIQHAIDRGRHVHQWLPTGNGNADIVCRVGVCDGP